LAFSNIGYGNIEASGHFHNNQSGCGTNCNINIYNCASNIMNHNDDKSCSSSNSCGVRKDGGWYKFVYDDGCSQSWSATVTYYTSCRDGKTTAQAKCTGGDCT
jgi:hypothetical protein